MASPAWTIVAQTRDRLGESAMWHVAEQAIYWVDWYGPILHRLKLGNKIESWTIPDASILGSFVFASKGRMVLATDSGLRIFNPATGKLDHFADPNLGREGVSYNDSKLDPFGRLWVGTFDLTEKDPRGILYCVESRNKITVSDSGYTVCNGPAFSPDGLILYFSDSVGKRIIAYDTAPDSPRLANRRIFVDLSKDSGLPDGLTVDAEGCLWCAHYGAGRVTRYAPDGKPLMNLELPCENVTSCAFGGPSMTTLFVTTGWSNGVQRAADEPGPGGALMALDMDIRGIPEQEFDPGED